MTIRWGIIGCGDVSERKSGPALYQADRSELVGVTNRRLAKAESFAARHGNPTVFGDVHQLLESPDIDAVYVATPPSSHAELTILAAAAGKHVLCEKPMALTVAQCNQMIDACRTHNVSLAIAYYRRYFPVVQKMRQLIEAGSIGSPLRVSTTTFSMFHAEEQNPWRLVPTIGGGGFLMDVGTHRLDLMAYLFGRPHHTTGIIGTQTLDSSVEDAATVMATFDGDVQASATFQWNCPVARDELQVVGTEGVLTTDSLSDEGRLVLENSAAKEYWTLPASVPVHLNLVHRFVEHLLDGTANPLSGESGMIATSMVEQIYSKSAVHNT